MIDPALRPRDEAERLRVLASFAPEALAGDAELVALTQFAAHLCNVPVSQVALVEEERLWFVAGVGLDHHDAPRETSFGAHTILHGEPLVVPDASLDPRFRDTPLVTGPRRVRFYAAHPLISEEGAAIGALGVIGSEPRPGGLEPLQKEGLAVLAAAVMRRLSAIRAERSAARAIAEREEQMRRMIESMPQIAWSADAEGRFDYFNSRWTRLTGAPPPTVSEDWRPFIHPDDADRVFADWAARFAAKERYEAEYRLRCADGGWRWVLSLASPVTGHDEGRVRWFGTITDFDEVQRALEARDMLARELSHRIKNIFAVVSGLVTLRARRQPEHLPFARNIAGTLAALGRAHDFVRPDGAASADSLQGLLRALFTPYEEEGQRIFIEGADVPVSPAAAMPLALIFHELATNAAKYGALSGEGGRITLRVEEDGPRLRLTWTERGGPPPAPASEPGFGTRLIEVSATEQLKGSWARRFTPEGMAAELEIARSAIC